MIVRGFTPYEKQQEWIDIIDEDEVKYVTLCSGRQIGKSLLGENLLLRWALSTPNQTIMFVSPIYSQVRKVFEDIEKAIGDTYLLKGKNKSNYDMDFVNGSKILFRSGERPDGLRGYTLDYLIVDEAAYISDRVWEEVLRPTILVKGKKVLFTSTPRGKNWFYKQHLKGLDDTQPSYRTISASTYDNPFIDDEDILESRKSMSPEIYEQEILGRFVDGGGAVFKNLDQYCIIDNFSVSTTGRFYGGIDVGRADDYSVLTILNEVGEVVYIYRERQKSWETIVDDMVKVLKRFNAMALIEVNGLGDVIYEVLKKKYNRVDTFLTTNSSKTRIIEDLIYGLNNGELTLPSETLHPQLYNELSSFSFKYSPKTRKVQYEGLGNHDDLVMSLAITYNCFKQKKTKGQYYSYGGLK